MKKKLLIVVAVLTIIGGVASYSLANIKTAAPQPLNMPPGVSINNIADTNIKFIATGDWIAHDSINSGAKQSNGSYNYLPMVSDFLPVFKAADIRFCNDPILNGGQSLGISGYPKFNSPTDFVKDMGRLGCNLANLASNHSFDFSQQNITNSVAAWQKVPNVFAFAGENQNQAQHDQVHTFMVKGVKFAFLAYTTYINTDAPIQNNYGVNIFSDSFADQQINQARAEGAKFIIASMRWGTEYSSIMTPEEQQDAQWLADHGVNLILGHGTHVAQPVAWLNGPNGSKTLVWYGLGDFLHTQIPADTVFNGIASMIINPRTLQITSIGFLPIYMHYDWTDTDAKNQELYTRHDIHLYPIDYATQTMINDQQLNTTVAAQEQRLTSTLTSAGVKVSLLTLKQYYQQQ